MRTFTSEEKEWLSKNYPLNESRAETYRKFVEQFGKTHSISSVVTWCKKHKLHKPIERHKYQKGNKPWSNGLSKEEHKKHFSKESYKNMTDTILHNFKHIKERKEYNVPDGYVLSDLGNGEKLIMEKSIHKCLRYFKLIGKGELTKTMYEIYLAKREIEKQTGKRLRPIGETNTKEYLAKIRTKRTTKYNEQALLKIKELRSQGVSAIDLGKMFNVSRRTINNYLKRLQ